MPRTSKDSVVSKMKKFAGVAKSTTSKKASSVKRKVAKKASSLKRKGSALRKSIIH